MKIGALVILYNPTEENITNIVNCLEKQVDKICMVDNSDKDNSHLLSIDEKIIYFRGMRPRGAVHGLLLSGRTGLCP